MTLTCCEKKLKGLKKCLGLGLSESRLGRSCLELKLKRLGLGEMWEGLGLGLKNKCLGLVSDLMVLFTTLRQGVNSYKLKKKQCNINIR